MFNEVPWTFKTWIANFENVDLPIGDLAQDIARVDDFPEDDNFGEILDYIGRKSRWDSVIVETFCTVWNFYLATK